MSQIKVCPGCGAEYQPHIVKCSDCGVPLMFPEEIRTGKGKTPVATSRAEWVEIQHDSKGWIEELSDMLSGNGVPARVELAGGCRPGQCGARYRLLVPKNAAQDAAEMINEYFVRMHPEAGQAEEWAAEGKCPACGHPVDADAKECPDCGLSLCDADI